MLEIEFLVGSQNAEVAVGVVGKALGYSFVNSAVYVDHRLAKAETAIFTNISHTPRMNTQKSPLKLMNTYTILLFQNHGFKEEDIACPLPLHHLGHNHANAHCLSAGVSLRQRHRRGHWQPDCCPPRVLQGSIHLNQKTCSQSSNYNYLEIGDPNNASHFAYILCNIHAR